MTISILAPRMWGDGNVKYKNVNMEISILAPRMWGDKWSISNISRNHDISILAPRMWGDDGIITQEEFDAKFQSSPHVCEATTKNSIILNLIDISILAPRMWGDIAYIYYNLIFIDFNPRPTYVRRRNKIAEIQTGGQFQSSPHVCEATLRYWQMGRFRFISILAPRMWGDEKLATVL